MKYLIDSDHASLLQKPGSSLASVLDARMAAHAPDEFALSIVGFHEQILGAHEFIRKSRNQLDRGYAFLELVRSFYQDFTVLPFDAAALTMFGQLKTQRIHIGTMDLRIAAIALTRQLTVLTRNVRDFRQVPGLIIEDWTL